MIQRFVTPIKKPAIWLAIPLLFCLQPGSFAAENEKALKYHSVLVKRPSPGYLFDRFFNAWLDTGSLAELETFLEGKVSSSGTTADRLLLAYFYSRQGDSVQALGQFRSALENDPDNAEARFQMAQAEARTLDFDSALKSLELALGADPKPELANQIRQLQGRLLTRNGENQKAMQAWKELLAQNPDDEELREDLIELQLAEGLTKEAAQTAEELISKTKDPYKSVLRQMRLGDIHQHAGLRQKAIDTYAACLDKVGAGSWIEKEIYAQIEKVYRREDDLTGLKKFYADLIGKQRKSIPLLRQNAELLGELGESDAAIEAFKGILEITPGDRPLREAFIDLLTSLEQFPLALAQLDALATQHPEDGEIILRKAELQHRLGESVDCERLVAEFLAKSAGDEADYLRACRLLDRYQLREAADRTFTTATEKFPDSPITAEAHASYLHKSDRKEEAIAIWKKLAHGGDRSRVVSVARSLVARSEIKTAYELLEGRLDEFSDDPIFLSFLCEQAARVDRSAAALPWARKLVRLAQSAVDLDLAIGHAKRLAHDADETDALIADLQDQKLGPQESCLLAELLESNGDSQQAEAILQTITAQHPLLASTQLTRLYEQRGDWLEAARLTEKIIDLPGGRKSVHLRKVVELAQRAGDFELALKWLPEWKKISPGSTLPWLTEARIHLERNRPEEAIHTLRLASQQLDGAPDIRARLAQVYAQDGKLADAQRIYQQLYDEAEQISSKIQWVGELATIAEARGKTTDLVERFEERRKGNRNSIIPLLSLAEIHRTNDEYEDRRKALLEASRIKPDDIDLLHEIARIEEREGDDQRALATLERAAKLDKTSRSRERIARLYFNTGREEEAFRTIADMAAAEKLDARSIEGLANSMASSRNWEAVAQFLSPYLDKFPDDYRLRYFHALATEESGDTTTATRAFLKLLRHRKEIPGLQIKPFTSPMAEYENEMRGFLPAEAMELMSYLSETMYGYMHRENQGGMAAAMGQAGIGSVALPASLKSLRHFSLIHLSTMARNLDDEELAELKDELRDAGVAKVDLLMQLDAESFFMEMGNISEFLRTNPKDPTVNAFAILNAMNESELELPQIVNAFEIFEDDYPGLAFAAGMLAAAYPSPEASALIDRAVLTGKSIERPSVFTVAYILNALGSTFATPGDTYVNEKQRRQLSDLLVSWYPTVNKNSNYHEYFFYATISAFSKDPEPDALMDFINREVANYNSKSPPSQLSQMMMGSVLSQDEFIEAIPFPPPHLPGAPMYVLSLFTESTDNFYGELVDLDTEKITEASDLAKSPLLRVYLLAAAEDTEELATEMERLSKKGDASIAELMLAASYFGDQKQLGEAMRLLKLAQFLPMKKTTRITIDTSLVAWALELAKDEDSAEENEELIATGRAAALRLRRSAGSMEKREELARALESLGLEAEAEKLAAMAKSMAPSIINSARAAAAAQDLPERVEKMIEDGKQDRALRLLTSELRNQVNLMLRPSPSGAGYFPGQQHWEELLGIIESRKLTGELLESLAPPPNSLTARKLVDFGAAHEALGEFGKAHEHYRKALELEPNNTSALMRYAPVVAASDPEAALGMFRKLRPQHVEIAGTLLVASCIADRDSSIAQVDEDRLIGIAEMSAEFLTGLERPERYPLEWITPIIELCSAEEGSLGALRRHIPPSSFDGYATINPPDPTPELERTRDRLITAMLSTPQLSHDAFDRHLELADSDEERAKQTPEIARQVLLVAEYSSYSGAFVGGWSGFSGYEAQPDPRRTPEFITAREAWLAGDRESIDLTFDKQLKTAGQRASAETLTLLTALYFEDGDAFVEAAEQFRRRRPSGFSYESVSANSAVVAIWEERDLDVDLGAFLLSQLEKQKGLSVDPNAYIDFATHLSETGGFDASGEFLAQFALASLGDEEKRASTAKKIASGSYSVAITINFQLFTGAYELICASPALSIHAPAIYHAFMSDLSEATGEDAEDVLEDCFFANMGKSTSTEQLILMIGGTPFFRDLDTFDPIPVAKEDGGTAFGIIGDHLSGLDDEKKSAVLEYLKAKPESLGRDLLIATTSSGSNQVYEILAEHRPAIQALPRENRRALASISYGLKPNRKTLSDAARELHGEFIREREHGERDRRDKFMSLDRLDRPEELRFDLLKLIRPLLADQRDEAHQLVAKAAQLAEDAGQDNYRSGHRGPGDWANFLISDDPDADALAFALEMITAAGNYEIELYSQHAIDSAVDEVVGEAIVVDELLGMINKLAPHIRRPETVPLLLGATLDRVEGGKPKNAQLAAIKKLSANSEHPEVINEFLKALSLLGDAPDYDHYLAYLGNQELSRRARLQVYLAVEERSESPLDQGFVMAAANVLTGAWASSLPAGQDAPHSILAGLASTPASARDESWEKTVRGLTGSWDPRYQAADERVGSLLLSLSLDVGNLETATRIASASKVDGLAPSPTWLQLLVKHEQFDLARKLLIKHWKNFDYPEELSAFRYDVAFPTRADEFIATLEGADLRFAAQLLLAASRDQRIENKATSYRERSGRVAAVARQFPGSGIKYLPTTRRFLTMIADFPAAADEIPERYAEMAKGLSFAEYLEYCDVSRDLDEFEGWQQLQFYLTHARQKMQEGGAPAIATYLALLDPDSPDFEETDYERAAGGIHQAVIDATLTRWNDWPAAQLQEIAKTWREHLARQPDVDFRSFTGAAANPYWHPDLDVSGFTYVLHTLAGDLDGLDDWRELESTGRARPNTELFGPMLGRLSVAFHNADLEAADRARLTASLLGEPFVAGFTKVASDPAQKLSAWIIERSLLSPEEYLDHGLVIARANPAQGWLAVDLAERLRATGRFDEAATAYDLAIATLSKTSMDAYTRFHIGKAQVLVEGGKKQEARELIDGFNTLRIPISEKGRWMKQLEQLEKQAAEE